ncbi:DUF2606 family protein [Alkalicoccobacillus murimartini]|uniref:Carboxypeptidase regulatory-like domain-containing protein n=1 Tax=Alkalicoccobacillus murimartini TaxID=171685 RepID=A0ABT9YEP0_9BACI|nr:DUF2606 family protein [Alkalicoccobacillus murimartini]MDQ0206083.1 hypothetical protein [Alkalicoccobacillus murimartini]
MVSAKRLLLPMLFLLFIFGCENKESSQKVSLVSNVTFKVIDQDGDPVPFLEIPMDNDIRDESREIGVFLGTTDSEGMIYAKELEVRTYRLEYYNRSFSIDEHDEGETIVIDLYLNK